MKRKTLGPIICLMCLVCFSSAAHAALSIVSAVGASPPSGLTYASFDSLPLGIGGGISSGITVTLDSNAAVVQGANSTHARPVISNSNGFLFGDNTVSGPDLTQYLTTGSTQVISTAKVTLDFPGDQQYLGLLWGSVDNYNTLSFYKDDVLIGNGLSDAKITGTNIWAFANGDQGANGTFYVNINSTLPFDRVVATSSQYAFEFDNVAYSANQIPEPGSLIVWSVLGLSVAGASWYRRRKTAA